jgi:hypothetical protein
MYRRRIASLLAVATAAAALLAARPARAVHCPNIMFVLDRSGSMDETPNGMIGQHPTKWELLQQAVKNVVTKYGDQVPFGMEMFTSNAFDDTQCYADTMIDVEPAHGTAPEIIMKVMASKPDGGTNTGEAIKRAYVDPAMNDASRGQYIILITDGDPNCNSGDAFNAMYTIGEIANAAARMPSVHTFVVGFDGSGGVNPDNLNAMAKAGLEPIAGCRSTSTSPCYYSASNATAFNDAINKILDIATGGEFGMTMCDDSCLSTACPMGYICTTDEINPTFHCAPDPCSGIAACNAGEYCRAGVCVPACPACAVGQKCVDGACTSDNCYQLQCSGTDVCDPQSGQCIANQCLDKNCRPPTMCDAASGNCVDDQCRIINCPAGTTCKPGGNCETGGPVMGGGGGAGPGHATVGCSVGARGPAWLAPGALAATALALGLAGIGALLRRRRRCAR